jgi:hypothetical protein
MRWNRSLIILIVFLASYPANAAQEATLVTHSEWFFPETKTWTPVIRLPAINVKYFNKVKDTLRTAYNNADSELKMESKDCSFITTILDAKALDSLRITDLNLDGFDDVIYTGSAICSEGDATLIWHGTKNGFQIKPHHFWPQLALKINKTHDPGISSVAVGCCADLVDTYFVGNLENPRIGGSVPMYRDTTDPNSAAMDNRPFQNESETVLRSAPKINDRFDIDASGREDHAIFGNVLSKYLGGAKGRIVFIHKDKDQKLWCYVVLSQESNSLRYHIGYPVNVGWVMMKSSAAKKK